MGIPSIDEIRELSVAKRIELVEDIWDSIAEANADLPLTTAQRQELDHRLDSYESNPDQGSTWDEARARVRDKE